MCVTLHSQDNIDGNCSAVSSQVDISQPQYLHIWTLATPYSLPISALSLLLSLSLRLLPPISLSFPPREDMYAQDSIEMLLQAGIQFKRHEEEGIDIEDFAELLMSSGLVLSEDVTWITFARYCVGCVTWIDMDYLYCVAHLYY